MVFVGCRCEGYVCGYGLEVGGMGMSICVTDLFLQKRGYFSRMHSPKTTAPTPIKIKMGEDHLATTTALSRPKSFA